VSEVTKQAWEKTYNTYYRQLVGCLITGVGVSEDGFPFFIVAPRGGTTKRSYRIEISQDPEGNGAGFLFIPEMVLWQRGGDDESPR